MRPFLLVSSRIECHFSLLTTATLCTCHVSMFFPFDDPEEEPQPRGDTGGREADASVIKGDGYVCEQKHRHCTVEEAAELRTGFLAKMQREKDPFPRGMREAHAKYMKGNWVRKWGVLCQKDIGKDATGQYKEEVTDKGSVKLVFYCLAAKHCKHRVSNRRPLATSLPTIAYSGSCSIALYNGAYAMTDTQAITLDVLLVDCGAAGLMR